MISLFIVSYVSLILVMYRLLKVRPTAVNLAVVVVVGVAIIGAAFIFWSFSSPMTLRVLVARYVVPVVPQVNGPVTKIHAEPDVPLKGGRDLLLEIQPDIFQNTVDQLTAAAEAARRNVDQLKAAAIAASAAVRRAEALKGAVDAEFQVANNAAEANPAAVALLLLQQVAQNQKAADAAVDQAKATAAQAEIARMAAQETVLSLKAQLANAQFNLDQCKVYAPTDGFVVAWTVRPGVMAMPTPAAPLGTFVDTSSVVILGVYPQNVLTNVKPGDEVELVFMTLPGQVFPATVTAIIPATGEGQLAITGNLPSAAQLFSRGMLAVRFELQDQELASQLKMGTGGAAAIYTQAGKPLHAISRVTIWIHAWRYYLLPM